MKLFLTTLVSILATVAFCQAQVYPQAPRRAVQPIEKIRLPESSQLPQLPESIIPPDDGTSEFTDQPMDFQAIGQLALAGQGIFAGTSAQPYTIGKTYAIALYFVMTDGIYSYAPADHSLLKIVDSDLRSKLSATAQSENSADKAPCSIIIAAATMAGRTSRIATVEAGKAAFRIRITAKILGLKSAEILEFQENQVKRLCRLTANQEPAAIISVGFSTAAVSTPLPQSEQPPAVQTPAKQRAVLIIPDKRFDDKEFFDTRDVLTAAGIETTVASWQTGIVDGVQSGKTEATLLVSNINIADFDAFVFIGGSGITKYDDDPAALRIAREAFANRKVVAAIDKAPAILAKAGILRGVRATSYPTVNNTLINGGAIYTSGAMEKDGFVVTAKDSNAASQFGRGIIEALRQSPPAQTTEEGTGRYTPKKVEQRRTTTY